jgi:DNA repair protein SbcD/Mre11
MKILHTADWHLGQKFFAFDREEEHRLTLDWLIEQINLQSIDLLIVAGDIFDVGNPPNYATKLYYNFFKSLLKTNCRQCIVIGGNHDSPAMLDAPKSLLEMLNIKVIAAATEPIEDEIIKIFDEDNRLQAVVAAVPFLRDRDLKNMVVGETLTEKLDLIKQGIYQHYQALATQCEPYRDVPIIATGHLFAKGAQSAEKQDNIYLGNMENISAGQFSNTFDYVALGHIHRAQALEAAHIRYSGSIIPLSFSENQDRKSITVVDFEGKKIKKIEEIDVPSFRKLATIKGDIETIKERLLNLDAKLKLQSETNIKLRAWVEILVENEKNIPNLDSLFYDFCKDMYLDILKVRISTNFKTDTKDLFFEKDLEDMSPFDVFQKKLESVDTVMHEELNTTFKIIVENIS